MPPLFLLLGSLLLLLYQYHYYYCFGDGDESGGGCTKLENLSIAYNDHIGDQVSWPSLSRWKSAVASTSSEFTSRLPGWVPQPPPPSVMPCDQAAASYHQRARCSPSCPVSHPRRRARGRAHSTPPRPCCPWNGSREWVTAG